MSIGNPRKLEHGFRRTGAGFPLPLYKGLRILMFQLSAVYCMCDSLKTFVTFAKQPSLSYGVQELVNS